MIETPSKFPDLLHSWEPTFYGKIVDGYPNANLKVNDIVDTSNSFIVKYQAGESNSKYGRNVMDENQYSILTMCSEDGLYFDVTLKKCMQFLDLSKMNDFTFKDLPSGYSGNYAMAFWVFFEESELYTKEKGLHINWSRHLQISIFKDTYLEGNCFPQGYYSDYVDNDSDFNAKFNGALNKAKVRLVPEGTSEDGKWIWVICSVSYYDRFFYFNGNDEKAEENIISEFLYPDEGVRTSYPMRFYLSDLNNNNMYKSRLSVININPEKKLYLREILLFRNYIPDWYAEKIKYMNVRDLADNQLPALAFVANFADFDLETKKLKYYIYERAYGSTNYERVETSLLLTVRSAGSTFELSANFKFQSLCDLDEMNPTKFDPETNICVRINTCILQDLKATYCMDEDEPISCQTGRQLTKESSDDGDGKIKCDSKCDVEEFIIPGTPSDRGICNANCSEYSKDSSGKCPISARSMKCGEKQIIGYKCIDKSEIEKSALFFSKCYNSPNFYRTISTNTINKLSSGYFYEFWIKLDNQLISADTCKEAGQDTKEYLLYSTPHSIYKDNSENVFYYQIINSDYKAKIRNLDKDLGNKQK